MNNPNSKENIYSKRNLTDIKLIEVDFIRKKCINVELVEKVRNL